MCPRQQYKEDHLPRYTHISQIKKIYEKYIEVSARPILVLTCFSYINSYKLCQLFAVFDSFIYIYAHCCIYKCFTANLNILTLCIENVTFVNNPIYIHTYRMHIIIILIYIHLNIYAIIYKRDTM